MQVSQEHIEAQADNTSARINNFQKRELMSYATTWLPALLSVAILVVYESTLLLVQRRTPAQLVRLAHASAMSQVGSG